uniref:Variant surface glycoprotein n=1 Tax=Trypanosoma brucei TaxID=5691 RepID=A0A1V0G0C8_9TRYP|nr:variant surface glycoprotein [Trypanosoma brucei]
MVLELIIALMALASTSDGAGENDKEFKDMCELYTMLIQPVTEPTLIPQQGAAAQTLAQEILKIKTQIVRINLTVLEKPMSDALADKAKFDTPDKLIEQAKGVKDYFLPLDDDTRQLMLAVSREDAGPNSDGAKFAKAFRLPLAAGKKQQLQKPIANLAATAFSTLKRVQLKQQAVEQARKRAREHMLKAVYGGAYSPGTTPAEILTAQPWPVPTLAAAFPWANDNKDNNCKEAGESGAKSGSALATDMLCICTVTSSSTSNGFCTGFANPGNQLSGSIAPAAAEGKWKELEKLCTTFVDTAPQTPAPEQLTTAVAKIFGHLGKNLKAIASAPDQSAITGAQANILGYYTLTSAAPQCVSNSADATTAATKGVCIDYGKALKKKDGVAWVVQVKKAAQELSNIKHMFSDALTLLRSAENIATQMESLLLMGNLLTAAPRTGPEEGSEQPTVEDQNKCAKFNSNETDCTTNGCNYEKTKKECKPKAGSECTAAAGTQGEQAGGKNGTIQSKTGESL